MKNLLYSLKIVKIRRGIKEDKDHVDICVEYIDHVDIFVPKAELGTKCTLQFAIFPPYSTFWQMFEFKVNFNSNRLEKDIYFHSVLVEQKVK